MLLTRRCCPFVRMRSPSASIFMRGHELDNSGHSGYAPHDGMRARPPLALPAIRAAKMELLSPPFAHARSCTADRLHGCSGGCGRGPSAGGSSLACALSTCRRARPAASSSSDGAWRRVVSKSWRDASESAAVFCTLWIGACAARQLAQCRQARASCVIRCARTCAGDGGRWRLCHLDLHVYVFVRRSCNCVSATSLSRVLCGLCNASIESGIFICRYNTFTMFTEAT